MKINYLIIIVVVTIVLVILGIVLVCYMMRRSRSVIQEGLGSTKNTFIMLWPKNNNNPVCDPDNLWSQNVFTEINYFNYILHPIGIRIKQRTPKNLGDQIDILGYSSNHYNTKQIQKIVNQVNPKILIHMSDEYGTRPEHNEITGVDTILRQYHWNNYPQKSHIYQIPVGEHCWDKEILPIVPINERKYTFSFIGTPKGERESQLNELKKAFDSYFNEKTNPSENKYIYNQSKFVFCPKGNVVYNCYRIYTAMRNGCIPIIPIDEKTYQTQFGHILGGGPPFIYKPTMKEVIMEMKRLLKNKQELEMISKEQMTWYKNHIKYIQNKINNILNQSK